MALIERGVDSLLLTALTRLRPYLDEIVVIGGVANALFRHHELAAAIPLEPIGTTDIDIATPSALRPSGRRPIAELLAEAGLEAQYHPAHSPPFMKFAPPDNPNVELEFLCPLVGSSRARGGEERLAAEIQPGVTAQKLRYLDLLLFEPWSVQARRVPELRKLPARVQVRVPNPAAYVMQKVLIRDQGRGTGARAKDCYYIYEIAVVFRDALEALHAVAERHKRKMSKSWWQRYTREARTLFASPASEGPVAAARQSPTVDESMVHAATARLLDAIT